jgi:hypothetical protein
MLSTPNFVSIYHLSKTCYMVRPLSSFLIWSRSIFGEVLRHENMSYERHNLTWGRRSGGFISRVCCSNPARRGCLWAEFSSTRIATQAGGWCYGTRSTVCSLSIMQCLTLRL